MTKMHISTSHKWQYQDHPFVIEVEQLEFASGKKDPSFYISASGGGLRVDAHNIVRLHRILRLVIKENLTVEKDD